MRDAQTSLNDTYYNHANDSISNAYGDELDSYTKSKEDYIEQLREALENVEQVVSDSMAQVLINADSILTGINGISSEYGVTLSDYLMLPWQNAALQATAYKESGILDLADFTEQTGIYSGLITEQINALFGNGSIAAGLFQTSVEGVVESISVTVNESTSPLTSDLQLPWETVKDYAQNTFAPEVMYALQSVADDASGKKEQLTNDLIVAFQAGVENAEEFNSTAIDALNNVIGKSNEFASVVPPNVSAPSDDPWDLWSNNIQSLIQKIIDKANNAVTAINNMNSAVSGAQNISNTIGNTGGSSGSGNGDGTRPTTPTQVPPKAPEPTKKSMHSVYALRSDCTFTISAGSKHKTETIDGKKYFYDGDHQWYYKLSDGTLVGSSSRHASYKFPKNTQAYGYYAKGTSGTKRDEWAITDEPQFGDELTMYATPQGTLSYMRAGSTVIPADITENLMKWGQFTPNMDMYDTVQGINLMSNVVNKPELNLEFDSLLHIDNCTNEVIPEVKKIITEQLENFTKKLNYNLKRVGSKS